MTTRLNCFTRRAQEPGVRFNALMGLLAEPEGLRESFESQPGNKAPGVESIDTADGLHWEPDGVALQVRFCEGGGTYHDNGIPAATLQIHPQLT